MPLTGFNTNLDPLQSDDSLTGVLQRLQDLYNQPLIANNPMAQAGSIMSGFAAGVKGQANPLVEQALERRKTAFSQMLGQANLALSMRREASLEQQRKNEEERAKKTQAQKELEFKTTQAWNKINTDIPELINVGANELNASGVMTFTPDEIEQLKSAPERKALMQNKGLTALRLITNPNDKIAAASDRAMAALAQNESGRAQLKGFFKIVDPELELAQRARAALIETVEMKKLVHEQRVIGGSTNIEDIVGSGKNYTKEQALMFAYKAEEASKDTGNIDPYYGKILELHRLEMLNAVKAGKAADLVAELNQLKIDAERKRAPWDNFEFLVKEGKTLLGMLEIAVATNPKDAVLIPKLKGLILKIADAMVNARVGEAEDAAAREKTKRELLEQTQRERADAAKREATEGPKLKPLSERLYGRGSVPATIKELLKPTHKVPPETYGLGLGGL